MGSTKEEIMTVALHLFAKNGYEAVSVSQIAGVLGMISLIFYSNHHIVSVESDCRGSWND